MFPFRLNFCLNRNLCTVTAYNKRESPLPEAAMAITSLDILNLSHSLKDICEVSASQGLPPQMAVEAIWKSRVKPGVVMHTSHPRAFRGAGTC